jgi:hypothetical protein
MNSHPDVTVNGEDTYRVEVSGWDAKENFFVEKTTLEWKPEGQEINVAACRYPARLYRVCSAASAPGNRHQFPHRL